MCTTGWPLVRKRRDENRLAEGRARVDEAFFTSKPPQYPFVKDARPRDACRMLSDSFFCALCMVGSHFGGFLWFMVATVLAVVFIGMG